MDFDLHPEQQNRAERARAAAGALDVPPGQAAGRNLWATAGALGLTGLCLPTELGGGGLGALDTALCLEAFCDGGGDAGFAFGMAAHLLACGIVVDEHAQSAVRAELIPGLAAGTTIAANAITEHGAGSDISRISTTATASREDFVLNGTKSWVSNAPLADVVICYASTSPGAGYLGISAFAVPSDLPGVHVGEPLTKLGLDGCAAAPVDFVDCHVPRRYLLGTQNKGSSVFARSMTWERACLPALYLGVMELQLRRCLVWLRERRQFGRRLIDFQALSHQLARMRQRLDASRLLLYRACWLIDKGDAGADASAALAKASVAESAVANSLDAVRMFGARGYLSEVGLGKNLLDAVPAHMFSGTTEIQFEIVVQGMGI